MDRHTRRQDTARERGRQSINTIHRQTNRKVDRHTERKHHIGRHTHRDKIQTGRQKDTEVDRQTEKRHRRIKQNKKNPQRMRDRVTNGDRELAI